jgi:hypothetical protein
VSGGNLKSRKAVLAAAAIAAGSIIIAAAVVWLYLFWYPTTPVYSLSQASRAITEHDWNTFSRYVDMEKLSMELAKEITLIAYQKMDSRGIPSYVSKNLAVMYGTRVKKSLPGDIEAWVKNGSPPATSVLSPMMKGPAPGKFRLKGISWKNGIAKARLSVSKTGVLEIELISEQGSWRITRINNVIELYEKSKGRF